MNRYFFYFVTLLLITGCATAPTAENILADTPPTPDKATLIAENDPWGRSLMPMQIEKNARFQSFNGERVSTFTNTVTEMTIAPGEHELEVWCSFRRGTALQLTNTVPIKMNFESDNIYHFGVVLKDGTCDVEISSLH